MPGTDSQNSAESTLASSCTPSPSDSSNNKAPEITYLASLHTPTTYRPSILAYTALTLRQTLSFGISSFFLILVVGQATAISVYRGTTRLFRSRGIEQPREWDTGKTERVVRDVRYYAQAVGLDIIDEDVVTKDGYILRCVSTLPAQSHHLDSHLCTGCTEL